MCDPTRSYMGHYKRSCAHIHAVSQTLRLTKLQIIFHKRATKYRSLLRKMTYKDKGSNESSPHCTHIFTRSHRHLDSHSHGHRDTETQRHRGTQKHRYTHTDTKIQTHTNTPTHQHTNTQTHRRTDTHIRTHTHVWVFLPPQGWRFLPPPPGWEGGEGGSKIPELLKFSRVKIVEVMWRVKTRRYVERVLVCVCIFVSV